MEPMAILNLIVWGIQGGPAWGAAAQTSAFEAWSGLAASTLINSLWQGAVIACGLALCMRLAPSIPARLRYGMWAAGFAALVCLPFLPILIERLAASAFNAPPAHLLGVSSGSGMGSGFAAHPLFALDARWSLALAGLWIGASLTRGVGLAAHALRMRRLWNSASPVGAAHCGILEQSAVALGCAAPAEVCVTNDLDRPCVIGFFRPRILIPTWLLNRLTAAELEQVVLHESEHLRRMDDWANLAQKLCLVLFPLNPAIWWLERRLCAERETACDDGVVRRTQAPRAYAACLAGLAERGIEHRAALRLRDALSLGAWQRRPELAARVHRLLRRPSVMSPAASWTSVALVGCGLVAGTVALAHSPQLVAFVAPANQASDAVSASASALGARARLAEADFVQGSTAFAGSGAQQYRAVKTLAILPAGRATFLPRNNVATKRMNATGPSDRPSSPSTADQARQTEDSSRVGHSLAELIPAAVLAGMKAQQVSQAAGPQATKTSVVQTNSGQANATQSGWLVLTTFEEVQTTGSDEEVNGDAVVGESSSRSAGAGDKTSTSVTFTRLVLRFVLPASNVSPASQTQPGSNSAQPVVIPYRDGWLVIQL